MSDSELKVIVKAKELAVHTFNLTSNCNRCHAWDNVDCENCVMYLQKQRQGGTDNVIKEKSEIHI